MIRFAKLLIYNDNSINFCNFYQTYTYVLYIVLDYISTSIRLESHWVLQSK